MLALKYHPDKNKSEEACAQFQKIHEAYVYLSKSNTVKGEAEDDAYDDDADDSPSTLSMYLSAFIKVLFKTTDQQDIAQKICEIVYNKMSEKAYETSLEYLEKVDRRLLKMVYTVVCKYQQTLHVDSVYLDRIGMILQKKYDKDERIILKPSLKDLIEANLYRLKIGEQVFLVPLWHHELVYDNSGAELYVECVPQLPDNMTIDENNHLHITLTYELADIWQKTYIDVSIDGVGSLFMYPVENLNMVPTQTRILSGCAGCIPRIDAHDIYDIHRRGDIYLHVNIVQVA
jgi:hypothetical protein